MKITLIIVLISVIMLIAKSLSQQYSDKYDFYFNLNNFLNQFKLNLSFKQTKILEFLNSISCRKQFKIFIENYKNYLSTGVIDCSNITILDDQEIRDIEDIVRNIGLFDAEHEIFQLESYLNSVQEKLKQAEENKKKICPMILKLSFLLAIGLAVILI